MRVIDLHAHTTTSDGALLPQELVRLAKARGVSVLAVTDHDTLAGIPSAMAEGARVGLEIVPGVEVTAYVDDLEVHILGHFIHPDDARLTEFLAVSRDDRIERIRRMIDKLWSLGLPLDAEEILKHAPGASVGRPHLAQAMVRRGYVSSVQEAFDRYLTAGKPAHVERARIPAAEVMSAIKRAGGVPSLAHPGVYRRDEMIPRLVEQGLMGLEVHHPDHDADAIFRYERMRLRYGMLAAGGSDYHGAPGLRTSSLGRPSLPEAEFERLAIAARDGSRGSG
ncbi:MAG: PHP domain-containing protein [candidate division NC10 bacterium]|nr:PHP domain-containing protein [candidate division NC10 bacterium]